MMRVPALKAKMYIHVRFQSTRLGKKIPDRVSYAVLWSRNRSRPHDPEPGQDWTGSTTLVTCPLHWGLRYSSYLPRLPEQCVADSVLVIQRATSPRRRERAGKSSRHRVAPRYRQSVLFLYCSVRAQHLILAIQVQIRTGRGKEDFFLAHKYG